MITVFLAYLWATEDFAYFPLARQATAMAVLVSTLATSTAQEKEENEGEEVSLETEMTTAVSRATSLVTPGVKQDKVKLTLHLGERSSNKEEEESFCTKLALPPPSVRFPLHVWSSTLDLTSSLHLRKVRCSPITSYRQVAFFPDEQVCSEASATAECIESSSMATKNPVVSSSPNLSK